MMIDLEGLLSDKETPACIKGLITSVKKNGVLSVGYILKNMSTFDIVNMIESAVVTSEYVTRQDRAASLPASVDVAMKGFMMLANLTGFAEGGDFTLDPIEVLPRLQYMKMFLTLELVSRNCNKIKLSYDDMSVIQPLGKDKPPLIVVEDGHNLPDEVMASIREIDKLVREKFVYTTKELEEKLKDGTFSEGSYFMNGSGVKTKADIEEYIRERSGVEEVKRKAEEERPAKVKKEDPKPPTSFSDWL